VKIHRAGMQAVEHEDPVAHAYTDLQSLSMQVLHAEAAQLPVGGSEGSDGNRDEG
jgi:hypothetical protein